MNFLETIWSIVIFCLFLSYLILLFQIVADIFRDSSLSGGFKALWIFFLLVAPVITALIYIIVRGAGMTERTNKVAANAQQEAENYVRRVAGTHGPADQILAAKALLDSGAINEAEYLQLKSKVLA